MNCVLCGRSILTRPKYLSTNYGTLPFCEDADGCRRMTYDRTVVVCEAKLQPRLADASEKED